MVGLGLISPIAKAGDPDLELARHLIVDGKPLDAYTLLEPYEFEQAGNTEFDYLLGLAALNGGHADKASLILERVLEVDPLHAAARVDLGRAYYLLGDSEHARAEFLRAQALNPPPSAQATIILYLRKIEHPDNKPMTRLSGYFEVGSGYNNNVNNSTSESQIFVPVLANAQLALNSVNVKTADGYFGFAVGGEAIRPVSTDWSLYAGVDTRSRNDLKYNNFDYISVDGRAGAIYDKNAEQIRGGLVTGQFNLGGAVNHKSNGFNAEWRHALNGANQAVLFGQYTICRYPDPVLATNNFDQTIAGLGWARVLSDGRSSIFGSLYGGNEHDTNQRIDGGKSIQGLRLSWQLSNGEKLDMYAFGGVQWGKYDRANSSFSSGSVLVIREDHQADLTAGLSYSYMPDWIVRPQLSLIQNQSNIIVDKYNQADFSITLRRSFK